MNLVSLQLWLQNRKIEEAKTIEIIDENGNLRMIPSKKGRPCRCLSKNSSGEKLGHGNGGKSRGWPKQQVDFYIENSYGLMENSIRID